jgi:hypothetical protein
MSGAAVVMRAAQTYRGVAPDPPAPGAWGAGPNAPAWAYTPLSVEQFDADLPVLTGNNSPPVNENGWRGAWGFTGFKSWNNVANAYTEVVYNPGPRVEYPNVATPIGTKRVLEWKFPSAGPQTIAANGEMTQPWPADQNVGLRVVGTWVGTLQFEVSSDGGATWAAQTFVGVGSTSGTSTSVNGTWKFECPISGGAFGMFGNEGKLVRVRASAWTSGTATVYLGWRGGQQPIQSAIRSIDAQQAYLRFLVWNDPLFTAAGTAAVKFCYFNVSASGSNHFFEIVAPSGVDDGFAKITIQLQGSWSFQKTIGSRGPAHGTWLDIEMLLTVNTNTGSSPANGKAEAWINGTKLLNSTTIPWLPADATTRTFTGIRLLPMHGGGQGPAYRTNVQQLAAWYSAGAPLSP